MTNEVANAAGAAATGASGLNDALNAQFTQGQELWNHKARYTNIRHDP